MQFCCPHCGGYRHGGSATGDKNTRCSHFDFLGEDVRDIFFELHNINYVANGPYSSSRVVAEAICHIKRYQQKADDLKDELKEMKRRLAAVEKENADLKTRNTKSAAALQDENKQLKIENEQLRGKVQAIRENVSLAMGAIEW